MQSFVQPLLVCVCETTKYVTEMQSLADYPRWGNSAGKGSSRPCQRPHPRPHLWQPLSCHLCWQHPCFSLSFTTEACLFPPFCTSKKYNHAVHILLCSLPTPRDSRSSSTLFCGAQLFAFWCCPEFHGVTLPSFIHCTEARRLSCLGLVLYKQNMHSSNFGRHWRFSQ